MADLQAKYPPMPQMMQKAPSAMSSQSQILLPDCWRGGLN
jgi:hypothetical protein